MAISSSAVLLSCSGRGEAVQLPSLEGVGLSGLYAGKIGNRLYAAGGCNFPDKPLVEGGKKAFHDEIWVLGDKGWEMTGTLPEPSAYGAYFCTDGALVVAGGANAKGTLDKVWMLTGNDGVKEMAPLPRPLEQAAWCGNGGSFFLAGGLSNGQASSDILEYRDGSWSVIGTLPRPLVQGIATMSGDTLCIWGGFDPSTKEAVTGGYALDLHTGEWSPLKVDITFAGSAALDAYAVGGCDAAILTAALGLDGEDVRKYQMQPVEYYRFRGALLHLEDGVWTQLAVSPHLARAGAAIALWEDGIVSIGGELKPGVRSPEVWKIKLK